MPVILYCRKKLETVKLYMKGQIYLLINQVLKNCIIMYGIFMI